MHKVFGIPIIFTPEKHSKVWEKLYFQKESDFSVFVFRALVVRVVYQCYPIDEATKIYHMIVCRNNLDFYAVALAKKFPTKNGNIRDFRLLHGRNSKQTAIII